jgi:cobalamin-dependent methionine synthase I
VAAEGLVIGLVTAGPAIESRASELLAKGELTRAVLLDAAGSAAAEAAADELGRRLSEGAAAEADPTASANEAAAQDGERQLVDDDAGRSPRSERGRDSRVSCRLSPGYGRWTLRWQRELFARLPHHELGVELNESCLMLPRKSVSFAMWLGARERIAQGIAGCSDCTLGQCRYRRRAAGSADSDHERGSSP